MKKKRPARGPLFEVRHSPIHGHGVFALRKIRKGTTVAEYLGDRVSHAEADVRYGNKAPDDNHTFLFTVDARTVIDGGIGGNDARYINHACDPNCESTTAGKRVFIEAIRTIQPGEELAYDYQIQRDADDPPNVDEIFACRCGSPKCRGTMLEPRRTARKSAAKAPAKRARKRASGVRTERSDRKGSVARQAGRKRMSGVRAERADRKVAAARRAGRKRTGGVRAERADRAASAARQAGRKRPRRQ